MREDNLYSDLACRTTEVVRGVDALILLLLFLLIRYLLYVTSF